MKLTRSESDFPFFGDPECDRVAQIMSEIEDLKDAIAFSVLPGEVGCVEIRCRFLIDSHYAISRTAIPRVLIRDDYYGDLKPLLRDLCNDGAVYLHRQLAKYD